MINFLVDNCLITSPAWQDLPRIIMLSGGVDADDPRVDVRIITEWQQE